MEKISFIIPTVYKSYRLTKLLEDLENCEQVSEILLIEDEYYQYNIKIPYISKLQIIYFDGNKKYYNGCINLGMSLINNNLYALCNDDINFNTRLISDIINFYIVRPHTGVIGMHFSQFDVYNKILMYGFGLKTGLNTQKGWGVLMFNNIHNQIYIPEDLKHWCGDSYLLQYSKYPCYDYYGEKIHTEMSTSTYGHILEIGKQDQKIYDELYKNHKVQWL
jgi:hypothetical protein